MIDEEGIEYEKGLQANAESYCGKMKEPERTDCFKTERLEIEAWRKIMDTDDAVLAKKYPTWDWGVRMDGKGMTAEHLVVYEACRDGYLETMRKHSSNPEDKLTMLDKVGLALEGMANLRSVNIEPMLETIESISDLEMDGDSLKMLPAKNRREEVLLCAGNLGGVEVYTDGNWIGVCWNN